MLNFITLIFIKKEIRIVEGEKKVSGAEGTVCPPKLHVGKRQVPYGFTHLWNLKTNGQREKKRGQEKKTKNKNPDSTKENTLMVTRGRWVGDG